MKRFSIILCCASVISAIASCSKQDTPREDEAVMRFIPTLPGTKATDSSFEVGDSFGIYAVEYENSIPVPLQLSGNWANNSKATFDGNAWTVSPKIWWKDNSCFDVIAYYPFAPETESLDDYNFKVKKDQRGSGFTLSDLMWARAVSVTRDAGAVSLKFTHRLSRLDIRLVKGDSYEGDLPQEAEVRIHNTVTTALVDFETGDVEKAQDVPASSITAHCNAPGSFSAIVVPQKILNQLPLVEVITKDVSYLVSAKFIFEAGMRHRVNVILSDNPDKVVINVGGGIEDWN